MEAFIGFALGTPANSLLQSTSSRPKVFCVYMYKIPENSKPRKSSVPENWAPNSVHLHKWSGLVILLKRNGFSTKEFFIPSLLESRTLNWFAFWVSFRKQRILSNIFFQAWRNWLWGFRCCTAGCKLDASLVLTSILFCKLSSHNLVEWGRIKNAQFNCAKKRIPIFALQLHYTSYPTRLLLSKLTDLIVNDVNLHFEIYLVFPKQ